MGGIGEIYQNHVLRNTLTILLDDSLLFGSIFFEGDGEAVILVPECHPLHVLANGGCTVEQREFCNFFSFFSFSSLVLSKSMKRTWVIKVGYISFVILSCLPNSFTYTNVGASLNMKFHLLNTSLSRAVGAHRFEFFDIVFFSADYSSSRCTQ